MPRPRTRPFGRRRETADPRPVWAACAALLDYPTPELRASLDRIAALVPGHEDLQPVLARFGQAELRAWQEEYVETFDHTRKCALHLTYYAYGDTRRRGQALVRFKEAYRASGVTFDADTGELPDHLCAVLQFGALVDADAARDLLIGHRAGLEMLRLALAGWRRGRRSLAGPGTGSPWHGVLVALCSTLPDLQGEEADAVRRLVEQGPPREEVGLEGYGADPRFSALSPPGSAGPELIASGTIPVGAPR